MKYLKQLLLLSALVFLAACENSEKDTTPPKIEIIAPEENTAYKFGETIKMRLNFDDPSGIMEFQVEVFREEYTAKSFDYIRLVTLATTVTSFSNVYEVNVPENLDATTKYDAGNYVIRIKASDYNMNVGTVERKITINYPEAE